MSGENAETLRAGFDALARGDIETAQAAFHPDAEIRSRVGTLQGEVYRGENIVRDWLAAFSDVLTDYRIELEEITGEGDAFVATVRQRATAAESGIPLDERLYIAYRFKDGRVWRAQGCSTTEEAREVAGL